MGNSENIPIIRVPLVQRHFVTQVQHYLLSHIQNMWTHHLLFPSPYIQKNAHPCMHACVRHSGQQWLQQLQWGAISGHVFIRLILLTGSFTAGGEKNSKTELMCVFVLQGRGEPFFSPSTNRKTLAAFSQDRGRQWRRERSQSDIDLNQTNPPLMPM